MFSIRLTVPLPASAHRLTPSGPVSSFSTFSRPSYDPRGLAPDISHGPLLHPRGLQGRKTVQDTLEDPLCPGCTSAQGSTLPHTQLGLTGRGPADQATKAKTSFRHTLSFLHCTHLLGVFVRIKWKSLESGVLEKTKIRTPGKAVTRQPGHMQASQEGNCTGSRADTRHGGDT